MDEIEIEEAIQAQSNIESLFVSPTFETLPEIELAAIEIIYQTDNAPMLNSDSDCACG